MLKEGSYDVDRVYFRVMRIQTIAERSRPRFLTCHPERYETSSIVFD
jgi:hypothetical protein